MPDFGTNVGMASVKIICFGPQPKRNSVSSNPKQPAEERLDGR